MLMTASPIATCSSLTKAISKCRSVDEIYSAASDALGYGLGVDRASILLFDAGGVMRFKAYRGISDAYRRAVEGHTPWRPDTPDPQTIWVSDAAAHPSLAAYLPIFAAEGIAALAFIPLVSQDRVIGKFMLYYADPTDPTPDVLRSARTVTGSAKGPRSRSGCRCVPQDLERPMREIAFPNPTAPWTRGLLERV
jgi:GAF domain-containing protein